MIRTCLSFCLPILGKGNKRKGVPCSVLTQTISTANTQQQNQVIANAKQQQQQPQQQQNKVEPRTVQGDLNNLDSQKMMSLAARFQEIEKQKEANQKAAADAQEKLDSELDEVQNTVNAALNGKIDNIVG